MSDAIRVAGLVKHYGTTRALDGLNLAVRTGEVHGFLGPNGAGKSTTIRAPGFVVSSWGTPARLRLQHRNPRSHAERAGGMSRAP